LVGKFQATQLQREKDAEQESRESKLIARIDDLKVVAQERTFLTHGSQVTSRIRFQEESGLAWRNSVAVLFARQTKVLQCHKKDHQDYYECRAEGTENGWSVDVSDQRIPSCTIVASGVICYFLYYPAVCFCMAGQTTVLLSFI
jgi:hypothetical protein